MREEEMAAINGDEAQLAWLQGVRAWERRREGGAVEWGRGGAVGGGGRR